MIPPPVFRTQVAAQFGYTQHAPLSLQHYSGRGGFSGGLSVPPLFYRSVSSTEAILVRVSEGKKRRNGRIRNGRATRDERKTNQEGQRPDTRKSYREPPLEILIFGVKCPYPDPCRARKSVSTLNRTREMFYIRYPMVNDHVVNPESMPRRCGGAISVRYTGTRLKRTPNPKPWGSRTVMSMATETELASKAPPVKANVAARANDFFRPRASESQPWANAPIASPKLNTPLTPPRILAIFSWALCLGKWNLDKLCGIRASFCLKFRCEASLYSPLKRTFEIKVFVKTRHSDASRKNRKTKPITKSPNSDQASDKDVVGADFGHSLNISIVKIENSKTLFGEIFQIDIKEWLLYMQRRG